MNAIPFIHLQENESQGRASCGCLLTHDEEGNPLYFECPLHAAAPDLLKALEQVAHFLEEGYPWPTFNSRKKPTIKEGKEVTAGLVNKAIAKAKGGLK